MSANAATWFYREPEHNAYLISERLNGTFWQARIVDIYWRCTSAEPPFRAIGLTGDQQIELEWLPGKWLTMKFPAGYEDAERISNAVSTRVLALPASLMYGDHDGRAVYEWHADGGKHRWSEIQGRPEYVHPRRLGKK
jgi:hypothetical protein